LGKRGFLSIYFRMFVSPRQAFLELGEGGRQLRHGLLALMVPAIFYTIFYILAYSAGGAPSAFKPWLALPIERYFLYGIFLAIPGYLCAAFVGSSVLYILLRLFGKAANYDEAFSVVGFAAGVATWSTLVHDFADSVLSFLGIIDMRQYEIALNSGGFWDYLYKVLMLLYLVWFLAIYYRGIRAFSGLGKAAAIAVALAAFMSFQAVLVIFIR
jgi:hypothetical protein